ncbi:MAG: helix-turn-helix domain-containing protein [Steroidobacteraceae bacterium]|nr:helix-turn-helix domain-containing protein [Steroidobacteraceae bacterium]
MDEPPRANGNAAATGQQTARDVAPSPSTTTPSVGSILDEETRRRLLERYRRIHASTAAAAALASPQQLQPLRNRTRREDRIERWNAAAREGARHNPIDLSAEIGRDDRASVRYVWTQLILRSGLSSTQRLVALVLATHGHADGGEIRPGVRLLAEEANLSTKAVSDALNVLVRHGYLKRAFRYEHAERGSSGSGFKYILTAPAKILSAYKSERGAKRTKRDTRVPKSQPVEPASTPARVERNSTPQRGVERGSLGVERRSRGVERGSDEVSNVVSPSSSLSDSIELPKSARDARGVNVGFRKETEKNAELSGSAEALVSTSHAPSDGHTRRTTLVPIQGLLPTLPSTLPARSQGSVRKS